MKLRITKKEKPYMRISYAMLYQRQSFKKNDRVQNQQTLKLGRIEQIDNMIHVIYDDKSKESYTKQDANKYLLKIKVEKQSNKLKASTLNVPKTKNERIDSILKEAIRKGEIEKDDVEIKKIELNALSDEELDNYEKHVLESYDEDISEESDEKTEAELALEELRKNGIVSQKTESFNDSTSRSLKDARLEHDSKMKESLSLINKDNVTKDGLTFDFGLEQMKKEFEKKSHEFVRPKDHVMQDLHGMTSPIVQVSEQFKTVKDRLQDIDWTTFGQKR